MLSLFVCLTSCNVFEDKIIDSPEDTFIGFVDNTDGEVAAKTYAKNGARLIAYNTLPDLLLAIENAKVDYGVLSDYEYISAVNADRAIKIYEVVPYALEFCAYFRNDSTELCDKFNASVESMYERKIIEQIGNAEYNGETFLSSYSGTGKNELKVLCNPSVDLFMYILENGEYSGIDVHILETFAEENDYSVSYEILDEADLFYNLEKGEGDMIISALTYNEQRADSYLASDIYFTVNYNLVTRTIS